MFFLIRTSDNMSINRCICWKEPAAAVAAMFNWAPSACVCIQVKIVLQLSLSLSTHQQIWLNSIPKDQSHGTSILAQTLAHHKQELTAKLHGRTLEHPWMQFLSALLPQQSWYQCFLSWPYLNICLGQMLLFLHIKMLPIGTRIQDLCRNLHIHTWYVALLLINDWIISC